MTVSGADIIDISGQVLLLNFARMGEDGLFINPYCAGLYRPRVRYEAKSQFTLTVRGITSAKTAFAPAGDDGGYLVSTDGIGFLPVLADLGPASARPSTAYEDIQATATAMLADKRLQRVMLIVDSVGGWSDGALETVRALRALNKVKPVAAYVPRRAEGAAYIIAQAAEWIGAAPGASVGGVRPTVFKYLSGAEGSGVLSHTVSWSSDDWPGAASWAGCGLEIFAERDLCNYAVIEICAVIRRLSGLSIPGVYQALLAPALAAAAVDMNLIESVCAASDVARLAFRAEAGPAALNDIGAMKLAEDQRKIARSPEGLANPEAVLDALMRGLSFEEFRNGLARGRSTPNGATVVNLEARRTTQPRDYNGGPEAA